MGLSELILIAVGLSADAFAASLSKGLDIRQLKHRHAAFIALFFGGFQGLMPLIGWFLGKQFEQYITPIDHWIAFVLLAFIGGNMIFNVYKDDEINTKHSDKLNIKEIFILAVATSIDALTIGITFAFLKTSIIPAVSLIGIITFILSFIGVQAGHRFGSKLGNKAELAGGIVLILIGLKILLEHLNYI